MESNVSLTFDSTNRTLENHLWIYTAPVLLVFSIAGNVMTILIMSHKSMRGTSTYVYLTLMAVADMSVVIVGIIPEWLEQMDILSIWEINPWVCRVELWAFYTLLDFAIWILVAFTCDRVIAVCFPFHKRQYCTSRRAYIASGIVLVLANWNLHVFWTRGRETYPDGSTSNCGDLEPYVYWEESIRPWVVLAVASIGPFLMILSCNIAIVSEILRSHGARESNGFKQTTIMCLSISFAFLILITPNIILLIGKQQWDKYTSYWIARAIASQCVYINHSINFLLYAITGSRFREELLIRIGSIKRENTGTLTSRMISMTPTEKLSTSVPPSPAICMLNCPPKYTTQRSTCSLQNGKLSVSTSPKVKRISVT